ncbi:DUF5958 family protein [Pinibacter aurantiacus]|uniref:Uncharacterized protein n=1 Tax=Pinibacter aurantiacus TaxID=2851599 RepID=A0A9E2SEZ8_9BACT|nr:DUF5958 family protein [Pinibacter aurantiacus]MBV4360609.1 hypothetical protein [Pinibacter aurantiacus]
MKIEDQIILNRFGQGLTDVESLERVFSPLDTFQKRLYLNNLIFLIQQSKPKNEDIEIAIRESQLKATFTPCVLLRKGVANHQLQRITGLPEPELSKSFILLLTLFKIAYQRRFSVEKNAPDKWWYWDLSEESKIQELIKSNIIQHPD